MFVQRRAGWLAAGLVLAFGLVLSPLLVWPSALGATGPGPSAGGSNVYVPLVQRSVPTPTPTPPPVSCSTAPVLTSPANHATLDTLIPVLAWDSGQNPNATETNVQVYKDAALTQRVDWFLSSYRTTGAISWQPDDNYEPATTYYWLTFLVCGKVRGPNSDVRSFTTGSGGVILPAANPLGPADGTQLSGTTTTISWSAVGGALGYEQYMNPPGGRMWRTLTATSTAWSGLEPNTVYEWYVRARNAYAWGAESTHRHLTTGPAATTWSDGLLRPEGQTGLYVDEDGRVREAAK